MIAAAIFAFAGVYCLLSPPLSEGDTGRDGIVVVLTFAFWLLAALSAAGKLG